MCGVLCTTEMFGVHALGALSHEPWFVWLPLPLLGGCLNVVFDQVELLTGPSCWQPALAGTVGMGGYPTFSVTPGYFLHIGLDVVTKYLLSACRAIVGSNTTSTLAVAVGRVSWQNSKTGTNFPICIINYNGVVYEPLQFDMLVAC